MIVAAPDRLRRRLGAGRAITTPAQLIGARARLGVAGALIMLDRRPVVLAVWVALALGASVLAITRRQRVSTRAPRIHA
jgi:hypothetical protein